MPLPPGLQGYVTGQQLGQQRQSHELQQAMGLQGLLAQLQAQQQDQAIQGILQASGGNPEQAIPLLMKAGPKGMALAGQLQDRARSGALAEAQIGNFQRLQEADTRQAESQGRQQQALSNLSSLLQGPPQHQTVLNPEEAERMAIEQGRYEQEQKRLNPNFQPEPYRTFTPSPANVSGLIAQAGPALPANVGTELLRQTRPPAAPPPMTPFQSESLRLREAQLNRPPEQRLVPMPDPNDPTKAIFGRPQEGAAAFAPGSGGILNNQTIRERQIATQLTNTIKPHLDVMNAHQRYEDIRGTGDNSQANQFLAMQLMQMSKTGQRALPDSEIQRILGSGEVGGALLGRFQEFLSQAASGRRTTEMDQRLNMLADAMSKSSAERIGQEMRNARASMPVGSNPDNVTGTAPRIYGRYVITPTGTVHTFKNAAEARARLDAAARQVQ